MIDKIAAAIVLIISFVAVTAVIAFLNLQYGNVFAFDFTPINEASELNTQKQMQDLHASLRLEAEKTVFDSLRVVGFDSLAIMNTKNKVLMLEDSIAVLQNDIRKLSVETTNLEAKNAKNEKKKDSDIEYNEWIKTTSKLYESMDAPKAAKIIQKYSDNIAKDILYTIKKKKAAEILAELNPETAKRITRVP